MAFDAAAVARELLSHRARLMAAAAVVLREHHLIDDVFQQVVVQALEDTTRFHDADHLVRWAIRAARHRAVDMARARNRLVLDDAVYELLEAEIAAAPAEEVAARTEALRHCLDALPRDGRRLLRLRYEDALACGEIARKLGRSLDAVYQALSRLHRQLRACVDRRMGAADA